MYDAKLGLYIEIFTRMQGFRTLTIQMNKV